MSDAHHTQTTPTTKPIPTQHQRLEAMTRQLCELSATLEGGQVIARIITQVDDEPTANVARVISGWIGLIERKLDRLNDQVEVMRR